MFFFLTQAELATLRTELSESRRPKAPDATVVEQLKHAQSRNSELTAAVRRLTDQNKQAEVNTFLPTFCAPLLAIRSLLCTLGPFSRSSSKASAS